MKNTNTLDHVVETLNDLYGHMDPIQDKPLDRASAASEESIHGCLYRASCFLRQVIARDTSEELPPFFLTAEQQAGLIPADGPVRQAALLRQINRAAEGNACRPLTGSELFSWEKSQGLYQPLPEDPSLHVLSPKGEAEGLHLGNEEDAPMLYYAPSAQRFVFDRLEELQQHIRAQAKRAPTLSVHPSLLPDTIRDMERLSCGCHPETGEALPPEDPLCRESLRADFAQAAEALRHGMEEGLFDQAYEEMLDLLDAPF